MSNELFIWEGISTLYPPEKKVWVTGIPEKFRLDIATKTNSLVWTLDNNQCNISYWITDNVEGNREHSNKDNQKLVWVANWELNEESALVISFLRWKLNSILSWKSFVLTWIKLEWLDYLLNKEVSKDVIENIIRSKDFAYSIMNDYMWATQTIKIDNFWTFKVISLLWDKNYIFLETDWKYYNLDV